MSNDSILVLWISSDAVDARSIQQALAQPGERSFRLQRIEQVQTALARVAGGGVDVILLDLPSGDGGKSDRLEAFLKVRQEAPFVPIVLVCSAEDEGHALRAMRAGAANYVIKGPDVGGLGQTLRSAMETSGNPPRPYALKATAGRQIGKIVGFLGSKGGVGTTTVAMNVASVLSARGRVILVELRPYFGTMPHFFRAQGLNHSFSDLLHGQLPSAGSEEVEACLWPYRKISGLNVLFGPRATAECGEIRADQAQAISTVLAGLADYVVVDLPSSLSAANRAVIENCSVLGLVIERDPICVQSAQLMVRAVESWNRAPQQIGTVIMNRAAVTLPIPLPEIDSQLGRLALGVIPPAADLCLRAQNAHTPLVAFEPESLAAGCLTALADNIASLA